MTEVSGGRRRWMRSTKGRVMREVTQSRWPKTNRAGRAAQAVTNGRSAPSRSGRDRCGKGWGGWNLSATSGRHEIRAHGARDHAGGVAAGQELLDGPAAAVLDADRHLVDPHPDEPIADVRGQASREDLRAGD